MKVKAPALLDLISEISLSFKIKTHGCKVCLQSPGAKTTFSQVHISFILIFEEELSFSFQDLSVMAIKS